MLGQTKQGGLGAQYIPAALSKILPWTPAEEESIRVSKKESHCWAVLRLSYSVPAEAMR